MRTIYLDCGMGAAGDMLAGALFELVRDKEAFIKKLQDIGLDGVAIRAENSCKCGICGTHMQVTVHGRQEESHDVHGKGAESVHVHGDGVHMHAGHERSGMEGNPEGHRHGQDDGHHHPTHHHAGLSDIYAIVDALMVSDRVRQDVKAVYGLIAQAEGKAHGMEVAEVHFHEVGMLDAVADITLVAMLIEELAPEQVTASPVCVGYGKVHCAHGILPVPAPATLHLLSGIPCYAGNVEGELCTPTGAALLKYYVNRFENLPQMTVEQVGYGMGHKDFPVANCVRAVLGQAGGKEDEVLELRCNIDDMTPEELGYAVERLQRKALDVYTVPIGMKKSRTGILLNVMCREAEREEMLGWIFRHTSTIGIREYRCKRTVLSREEYTCSSGYGDIRIKRTAGFGTVKEKPEYEDLKRAAEKNDCSLREIKAALAEEGKAGW